MGDRDPNSTMGCRLIPTGDDMTQIPPAPTRRREHTRQKLLDAASEMFAEVGLDAASVEAVCERAGFTRGAFYSNFETKEEMFLELSWRVARERIAEVRARVAELGQRDDIEVVPGNELALIERVLDQRADERIGVLMMSEIRIHALRVPALAKAYLAQEEELTQSIAQILTDVAQAHGLRFRLPPEQAARLMLAVGEAESVRSIMAGVDGFEHALARMAQLLIVPADS